MGFWGIHSFLNLVLSVFPIFAYANPIKVLPDNATVQIKGRVGDESSFVQRVVLNSEQAVPEIVFLSEDLKTQGDKARIARHQIGLASSGKLSLAANTPTNVDIKIAGVKLPGTYFGQIYFLIPGNGMEDKLAVRIEVVAETVPKLTVRKGSEAVKLQLFDCSVVGCRLAEWMQSTAFIQKYPLQLENGSLEPFDLTSSVNVLGDSSRQALQDVLTLNGMTKVNLDPVITIPINIRPNSNLRPDHYTGDVVFKTSAPDAIRIPVDVNVRTGPIWPIITLLIGIILGRLAKYMKDRGGLQSDLLLHLYQIEGQLAPWPADRQLLETMIEGAKNHIYNMQLEVAKGELAAIDNRCALLATLHHLDDQLQKIGGPSTVPILAKIASARQFIGAQQDQQAASLIAQIQTDVGNLTIGGSPAGMVSFASRKATTATAQAKALVNGGVMAKPRWPQRVIASLTGVSGAVRAELTLWLVRPLFYVLLIIGLLVIGLQQLYLKNATFGTDPFSDYFGILVWAMSSDVASRTLASLKTGS
jgi:hypothetical protein